jgi:hypothetical protein
MSHACHPHVTALQLALPRKCPSAQETFNFHPEITYMSDDCSWASIRATKSSVRLLVPLAAAAIASALYLLSTRSDFHLDGMKKFLAHLGGDKHVSPQQAPVQQVMPPPMTGTMTGGPHPSGKKNVGYFVSHVDPHVSALR